MVAVSVGNETMVSWSFNPLSVAQMAAYIKSVRSQVTQPVTTDDNFQVFSNPIPRAVINQIDFVAIHAYPVIDTEYPDSPLYWDWKKLSVPAGPARATAMVDASIVELKKQYEATRIALDSLGLANMPIAITETGWKARITGASLIASGRVPSTMVISGRSWAASEPAPRSPAVTTFLSRRLAGKFPSARRPARAPRQPTGCGRQFAASS